jgi:hypothetical protein
MINKIKKFISRLWIYLNGTEAYPTKEDEPQRPVPKEEEFDEQMEHTH